MSTSNLHKSVHKFGGKFGSIETIGLGADSGIVIGSHDGVAKLGFTKSDKTQWVQVSPFMMRELASALMDSANAVDTFHDIKGGSEV